MDAGQKSDQHGSGKIRRNSVLCQTGINAERIPGKNIPALFADYGLQADGKILRLGVLNNDLSQIHNKVLGDLMRQ